MKNIQAEAKVIIRDREYREMPKSRIKQIVINQIASELEKIISSKDLSTEFVEATERGPSIMISLPFRIMIGEEERTFKLDGFGPMTEKEIVEYTNGNPGALNILMEFRAERCTINNIRYHELKGDKLYVIYNDCCHRDAQLFDKVLDLHEEVVKSLIEGYERTGRGQPLSRQWAAGRKLRPGRY